MPITGPTSLNQPVGSISNSWSIRVALPCLAKGEALPAAQTLDMRHDPNALVSFKLSEFLNDTVPKPRTFHSNFAPSVIPASLSLRALVIVGFQ